MARKILLADDSVTAQNMGRKILTDAGYDVITVNNGSSALKKIGESKPDLIVVDVYMPGYSGLEVCQRVKETRETAQIPVLLTVGKLEPFKQDEARRVRADAFIIKPFEASELLAALNKLEDKLVAPSPFSALHSQFSPAVERFERFSESGPKYGDQDSGWKTRLTIPSGAPKLPEFEPESEPEPVKPVSTAGFRDLVPTPAERAATPTAGASIFERVAPAGIPQDITPDEIAAITAAAVRVSVGKDFERLASAPPKPVAQEIEKTPEESKHSTTAKGGYQAIQVSSAPVAEVENALPATDEVEVGPSPPVPASPLNAEPNSSQSRPQPTPGPSLPAAEEVRAVPPSISSGNTNAVKLEEPTPAQTICTPREQTPQLVAISPALEGSSPVDSPRWIAVEVPLAAEESVVVLECEMHKAFAAFAAADAAQAYEAAELDRDDEPLFATLAPPSSEEAAPTSESASSPAPEESRDRSMPPGTQSTIEIFKPPAPPFTPASMPSEESEHAVAAFGGPNPFGEPEPKPVEVVKLTPQPTASSAPSAPVPKSPLEETSSNRREAELAAATAAAWANWKDIRESMTGSNQTSPASDPDHELKEIEALKGAEDLKDSPPSAPAAQSAAEDSSAAFDASLSTIVDSMLAELKPKLMAELAKKLENKKK